MREVSEMDRARGDRGLTGLFVLDLQVIDQTQAGVVGGKGANLGELSRIEGIRVPPGFCVTTDAFRRVMADAPADASAVDDLLERLSRLRPANATGSPPLSLRSA
jgi:rifampicin phosphotransferase